MKLTLDKHVGDQMNIKVYGRRVGYYHGNKTIAFLTDKQCKLTAEEKEDVVVHIACTLGLPVCGHWRKFADEQRAERVDAG